MEYKSIEELFLSVCVSMREEGDREVVFLCGFFFFFQEESLSFKHVEIFTVEMMCCLGFASKESRIVGRCMECYRGNKISQELRIVDW